MKTPGIFEGVWWRQPAWREYAQKLFRYYSLRRGYRVRFNPHVAAAAVNLRRREVFVNPSLPEPHAGVAVRRVGTDEHLTMLKAYLAHEAGHVRFSCEKPAGLLGQVWNALEDERIERLMSGVHPELEDAFAYLGDLFLGRAAASFSGDALEGCLYWRWAHDHPSRPWQARQAVWAEVRPLVEASWEATTSEAVVVFAKRILALLGLPEDAPEDSRFGSLSAGGARTVQDANESAGEVNGDDGGSEPSPPELEAEALDCAQAADLLADVEGYAQELAAAIKPPGVSRLARPHHTRGRFAFDRFRSGCERVYRHKPSSHQRPLEVRVCLDASGSMDAWDGTSSRLLAAVRACVMLMRAGQLSGVSVSVWGFTLSPFVVCSRDTPFEEGLLALARMRAAGGTQLHPALQQAVAGTGRGAVVVVICDGALHADDAAACKTLVASYAHASFLPLLIGEAYGASDVFDDIFGAHLVVSDLAELPRLVRAWFLARV